MSRYLESLEATDPENAPNIEYIPHTVNAKNMGDGLTGETLKKADKEVLDNRSDADKERIQDVHKTIKNLFL